MWLPKLDQHISLWDFFNMINVASEKPAEADNSRLFSGTTSHLSCMIQKRTKDMLRESRSWLMNSKKQCSRALGVEDVDAVAVAALVT